jgi:hypothetical protein
VPPRDPIADPPERQELPGAAAREVPLDAFADLTDRPAEEGQRHPAGEQGPERLGPQGAAEVALRDPVEPCQGERRAGEVRRDLVELLVAVIAGLDEEVGERLADEDPLFVSAYRFVRAEAPAERRIAQLGDPLDRAEMRSVRGAVDARRRREELLLRHGALHPVEHGLRELEGEARLHDRALREPRDRRGGLADLGPAFEVARFRAQREMDRRCAVRVWRRGVGCGSTLIHPVLPPGSHLPCSWTLAEVDLRAS